MLSRGEIVVVSQNYADRRWLDHSISRVGTEAAEAIAKIPHVPAQLQVLSPRLQFFSNPSKFLSEPIISLRHFQTTSTIVGLLSIRRQAYLLRPLIH
jgi:hypothetical protein